MRTLNLNDQVGVRLNDKGRAAFAEAYGGQDVVWLEEKKDEDGYVWMQWHELANVLGPHLELGLNPPCEMTVRLRPKVGESSGVKQQMREWADKARAATGVHHHVVEAGLEEIENLETMLEGMARAARQLNDLYTAGVRGGERMRHAMNRLAETRAKVEAARLRKNDTTK